MLPQLAFILLGWYLLNDQDPGLRIGATGAAQQAAEGRRRRRRRARAYWEHPLRTTRLREAYGLYDSYVMRLLEMHDDVTFKAYTRLDRATFMELLDRVTPDLNPHPHTPRAPLPAGMKLLITLRYMAAGTPIADLAHTYRCGRSTINAGIL